MSTLKDIFTKNVLTTVFGIVAGLPAIILGVFTPGTPMALSPAMTHVVMVVGGVGMVGLGVVSKAFNTHSTEAQVNAATVQAQQASQLPQGAPAKGA